MQTFKIFLQIFNLLINSIVLNKVSQRARSEVFTLHLLLINNLNVAIFNSLQIIFQFRDILLFGCLILFQDFFLSRKFSFQIFFFGYGFIDLSLESCILGCDGLKLPFNHIVLNFEIFKCHDLVFELRFRLHQLSLCHSMLVLLFLTLVNPLISGDFLSLKSFFE